VGIFVVVTLARRDPEAADWARLDFADFAQEFLRRDPAYRAAWQRMSATSPSLEQGGPGRRFGLSFLFRS